MRTLALLAVLALVVAACSGAGSAATTTSQPEPVTTTAPEPPQAVRLSYSLQPGASLEFEVGIDQHIDMTAEGDGTALGEEDIPGEMSVDFTGTTTFTHEVGEGPEPGTYEITVTGDFSDLDISGTIDGEPLDAADLPDFTQMEPVDVTLIVDEQGNVIPKDDEFGDFLGGGMGDLGDLGTPGMDPGRFVGPPFTDEEVTVGDTWSETFETPGFLTGESITTEVASEVTATDTVDGFEVFVISTESTTSAIEFDLAELLLGFFTGFVPEDATDEEMAELESLTEDLRFLFSIAETTSNLTTWFDAEEGLTRKADYVGGVDVVIDLNMPDEEAGEMAGLVVDLEMSQHVTYRLISATSA
jgi:hypothetical protein